MRCYVVLSNMCDSSYFRWGSVDSVNICLCLVLFNALLYYVMVICGIHIIAFTAPGFIECQLFLNSWRRKVAAERDADPSSSLVFYCFGWPVLLTWYSCRDHSWSGLWPLPMNDHTSGYCMSLCWWCHLYCVQPAVSNLK